MVKLYEESFNAQTTLVLSTGSKLFRYLTHPGKAVAGMSLNLFFTAAAVVAFEQELPGVGLVFLLAELAMYRGGRRAVREEAEAQLTRLRAARAANCFLSSAFIKTISSGESFSNSCTPS